MSLIADILQAQAPSRTRFSWNERFEHWERPASDSEEQQIERAARMVRSSLAKSTALAAEDITIESQGSYHNNTNVRLESDIDLRAVHPALRIEYGTNVNVEAARNILGISGIGRTYAEIGSAVRSALITQLSADFGATNVDTRGSKALRLKKQPGTRADVDVVPVFTYHWVYWLPDQNRYQIDRGITFFDSKRSIWVHNFPEQHYANGVAKRERTKYRFKKNVRSLKHLRDELVGANIITAKQAPSFLVECLTYTVEDPYFLVEADDRYDRVRRVLYRLRNRLSDADWVQNATEINGIKYLFRPQQPWTAADALAFVNSAITWLEA